jgi:outer membrane protein assembly factor BamB
VAYGTVFMPRGNAGAGEVVRSTSETIAGLCAFAGTTLWSTTVGASQGYSAPCLDGANMYTSVAYNPVVLGLADGLQLWRNTTSEKLFNGAAYISNRVYYVTSIHGGVRCFNSSTGTRLWEQYTLTNQVSIYNEGAIGYESFTAPAVAHGRVYVGCNDGQLHTFDQQTGTRGWTFATSGKVQSSPAVAGDVVYVGSWDGALYALDAISGALLWKYQTGGRIISTPWPLDDRVVVGSDDGCIYALEGVPEPRSLVTVGAAGIALLRACTPRK